VRPRDIDKDKLTEMRTYNGIRSSGQANAGFAIPAAKKKEAGWRDRLAAKF